MAPDASITAAPSAPYPPPPMTETSVVAGSYPNPALIIWKPVIGDPVFEVAS